jgi:hypothetical protein
MVRLRAQNEESVAPAASLEERWWDYLADLGRFDLGAPLLASGRAAIADEWLRLDGLDVPVAERAELLIAFCVRRGMPEWAVRARVRVGQAAAQTRPDDSPHTFRQRLAADMRRRRLTSTTPKGTTK